jgi:serine/threonine protein kinase
LGYYNHLVPCEHFQAQLPLARPTSVPFISHQLTIDVSNDSKQGNISQGSTLFRTPTKSSSTTAAELPLRAWASMPAYLGTLDNIPKILDTVVVSKLFNQMMTCIEYLHTSNFVHMDIKPSNIFYNEFGDYYLGDFGSACKIGGRITSTTEAFSPK